MPFRMTKSYSSSRRAQIGPDAGSVTTSEILIENEARRIVSVKVAVYVEHTWPRDLRIELVDPSGRSVTLVTGVPTNRRGVWAFNNTRFQDGATAIADGEIPFVGTFDPEGSLSTFSGGSANGLWILKITDSADNDQGKLVQWTLSITYEAAVLEVDWGHYRSVKSRLQQAAAAVKTYRYLRCVGRNGGMRSPEAHLKCILPGGPRILLPSPGDPVDPDVDQVMFEEQLMEQLPMEARAEFGEALMAGVNELLEKTLEELDEERALTRLE